jgi:hypothetical protein
MRFYQKMGLQFFQRKLQSGGKSTCSSTKDKDTQASAAQADTTNWSGDQIGWFHSRAKSTDASASR